MFYYRRLYCKNHFHFVFTNEEVSNCIIQCHELNVTVLEQDTGTSMTHF